MPEEPEIETERLHEAIQEASRTSWLSSGKEPPAKYADTQGRYAREQADISAFAKEIEHERDSKAAEAAHLLHQHHRYANSVALFQVAIALGAIAALSRNRWIWLASLLIGFCGTVLFV